MAGATTESLTSGAVTQTTQTKSSLLSGLHCYRITGSRLSRLGAMLLRGMEVFSVGSTLRRAAGSSIRFCQEPAQKIIEYLETQTTSSGTGPTAIASRKKGEARETVATVANFESLHALVRTGRNSDLNTKEHGIT